MVRGLTGNAKRSLVALALFFFTFLASEYLFDDVMGLFVAPEAVVIAQSYILGASVIGMLIFPLLNRRFGERVHKAAAVISVVLYVICMVVIVLHPDATTTQVAGFIAFIMLGMVGGSAHWTAALALDGSPYLSRSIGCAYAAGLLLQFALNALANIVVAEVVILIAATACMMFLLVRAAPIEDGAIPNALNAPEPANHKLLLRTDGCMVGVVALMAVLFATLDNVITLANAAGSVDVAAWPRLFLAASGVAAGFLFDIDRRRYMPLITLCIALLSTLALIVVEAGIDYLVCLFIFYISSGFFVVFFTTVFLSLAPRLPVPELWAAMGRLANNATAVVIGIPSVVLVSSGNIVLIIVVDLLLFVGITVLFFLSDSLRPSDRFAAASSSAPSTDALTTAERFDEFSARHDLTSREREVLELVVDTEMPLKQIAAKMDISTRMLQRYLSTLYEKTGVQSRVGLTRRFWDEG